MKKETKKGLIDIALITFASVWGLMLFVFFVAISANALYRALLLITNSEPLSFVVASVAAVGGAAYAIAAICYALERK